MFIVRICWTFAEKLLEAIYNFLGDLCIFSEETLKNGKMFKIVTALSKIHFVLDIAICVDIYYLQYAKCEIAVQWLNLVEIYQRNSLQCKLAT